MRLRTITAVLMAGLFPLFVSAEQVTFIDNTGAGVPVDVPAEIASIINDNHSAIQEELFARGISAATIQDVAGKINDAYAKLGDYGLKSLAPITDAEDGLNDLCAKVADAVPDSQMLQNVWAKAWLGEAFHIGGGLNAGLSFMSIGGLPTSPLVLSFILSSKLEGYFRRGISYAHGSYAPFVTRPLSLFLLLLAVFSVAWPYISQYLKKRRAEKAKVSAADEAMARASQYDAKDD